VKTKKYSYNDLIKILQKLHAPDGCPWDREQTHTSILDNLLEESYEAKAAILSGDRDAMVDELGDCLLQAIFHGFIADRNGSFDTTDIVDNLCRKLISRHTHIFGDDKATTADQALAIWQKNKHKSPYESIKNLPVDLPTHIKIKKLNKALDKNGVTNPPLQKELATDLHALQQAQAKVDHTLSQMTELLKT